MTVVYPLTVQHDYTELHYSLRSIEKYLNPKEVVIVGSHVPEWINKITHINLPDVPGRKQLSIKNKIISALNYNKEILFMNDDVYLLQPAKTFPYYCHGELVKNPETGSRQLYNELKSMNKPVNNFDGHFPLVYKQDFLSAVKNFSVDGIIKSMYCNFMGIEGIEVPDCKIMTAMKLGVIREFIKYRPCFSTGPYSIKSVLPVLEELFPGKSKYEL